jgi:hypothetical protein
METSLLFMELGDPLSCSSVYLNSCNFACSFVWVWNWVSDIDGGTYTKGVWEQTAEENIKA